MCLQVIDVLHCDGLVEVLKRLKDCIRPGVRAIPMRTFKY